MILKRLAKICSIHRKRGERVKEFNLSPYFYRQMNRDYYMYQKIPIKLVCEGWIEQNNAYYKILNTSEGIIYTADFTYTIE